MQRRDFLKVTGGLSAHLIVGGSLLSIRQAEAETGLPIAALQASLDPKKDLVLIPENKGSSKFDFDKSYQLRTQITPRVRVVAGSAAAVGSAILWATNNGIGFAIRHAPHSGSTSLMDMSQAPLVTAPASP